MDMPALLLGLGRATRELVLPARCAGCGAGGSSCCPSCLRVFAAPQQVYPPSLAATLPVYAMGRYRGAARKVVLAYKERNRRDLAVPLGSELAGVLPYLPFARPDADGTWWLVPAPSRPAAARVRGGSHTLMLARRCAQQLAATGAGCAVAPTLRLRAGARDAVGLDQQQRQHNLAGAVRVLSSGLPPAGAPVVLLDDVVTTGATAAACAAALRAAGRTVTGVLTLTAAC